MHGQRIFHRTTQPFENTRSDGNEQTIQNMYELENPNARNLMDHILKSSIIEIENFLGYPISNDIIENLDAHVSQAIYDMSDEELEQFPQKYNIQKE